MNGTRPLPFTVEQFHTEERYWFPIATTLMEFDAAAIVAKLASPERGADNVRVLMNGRVVWNGPMVGFTTERDVENLLLAATRAHIDRILAGSRVSA